MKQPIPIEKGHVPFARFLMALGAGITASYLCEPHWNIYAVINGVQVGAIATFVYMVLYTWLRRQRYYGFMGFLILLIFFTWGCRSAWQTHPEIDRLHFSRGEYRALIGRVVDEPAVNNGYLRFPLEVIQAYGREGVTNVTGKLMITLASPDSLSTPTVAYGDELLIPARYQEVPPPYNPGQLDYRRYLANKDIWHQGYLSSTEVRKLGAGKGNPLVATALKWRKSLVTKFERYLPDKDALSVASTLILGYRADLSEELLQAFSNTGTIHVLSVSGMHVVIVFWLFSKLMGWMDGKRKLRLVKFIILLIAVWSYAALTGFSPSVLRAAMMISFVMAASAFNQENRIYNSISASAFFLLLYEPKFIADIGFQLSYLAVLGIIFMAPLWQAILASNHRLVRPLGNYIGMSVSAQAGAGPLATYYFHQFPMYFLVANLFIALPASAIMYLGFVLLILPAGIWATWVGVLLEKTILFVNAVLYRIEQLPMATVRGIWIGVWDSLLIYLLFFSITLMMVNRSKSWFYGTLIAIALMVCTSTITGFQRQSQREIIVFNVKRDIAVGLIGNGDAWIYSNLGSLDNRTIQYRVLPGLERRVSTDRIHLVQQDSSYRTESVYVKDRVIQFGDTRLMVYDEDKTYGAQLEVDILLIRNNPRVSLERLIKNIRCKQLVVDGSNHRFTVDRLVQEAEANDIPIYVLKDNFAWTLTLPD